MARQFWNGRNIVMISLAGREKYLLWWGVMFESAVIFNNFVFVMPPAGRRVAKSDKLHLS